MVDVNKLLAGYKNFYQKYFLDDKKLYEGLAQSGQSPKSLVIACSDSRVDPSIILDTDPGDIFVIRNVANLIPPFQEDTSTYHGTSAALEFAVKNLEVENIILLGHSGCAGINELMDVQNSANNNQQEFSFVREWVSIAKKPSVRLTNYAFSEHETCAKESMIVSYQNLFSYPWIKNKYYSKELKIFIWFFDISTGNMESLDFEELVFKNIIS
jgi:carbonic anhydrase